MKNKKIIKGVLLTIIISLVLVINNVQAHKTDDIKFTPNVPIPDWGETGLFNIYEENKVKHTHLTGDSIGIYINVLYIYAARIASLLAIFMLVIAAWQWLFAAGSPEKISNAKSTITGALMGLALLFGGHLLLSQISSGLVELKSIAPEAVEEIEVCTKFVAQENSCTGGDDGIFYLQGPPDENNATTTIKCRGIGCSGQYQSCVYENSPNSGDLNDCTYDNTDETINCSCQDVCAGVTSCGSYKTVGSCRQNLCYRRFLSNGGSEEKVCGTEIGKDTCKELQGIDCADQPDICTNTGITNFNDSNKYCCDRENYGLDECELVWWMENEANNSHQCY